MVLKNILDGGLSHESLAILAGALANDINIFIPPNTFFSLLTVPRSIPSVRLFHAECSKFLCLKKYSEHNDVDIEQFEQ